MTWQFGWEAVSAIATAFSAGASAVLTFAIWRVTWLQYWGAPQIEIQDEPSEHDGDGYQVSVAITNRSKFRITVMEGSVRAREFARLSTSYDDQIDWPTIRFPLRIRVEPGEQYIWSFFLRGGQGTPSKFWVDIYWSHRGPSGKLRRITERGYRRF